MARKRGTPDRHLVHGTWMTESEAAEKLGRSRATVQRWRYAHRRPDGGPGLLEEAWDHYTDVNAGRIKLHFGRPPVHRLKGRTVCVSRTAEALGIPAGTLYSHMYYHRCGLDAAVRYYEAKRQRKAEREILRIINEG